MAYAPREDSDQPGHPPSLIRDFISSLSTWGKLRSLVIIRAHNQASDQAGRMLRLIWPPSLIWVFAGCRGHFVGFDMRQLILLLSRINNTDFCYFEAFYFLKHYEKARVFLCIHAHVCLSPFIMSYCRPVVILILIFHDSRCVSLFI